MHYIGEAISLTVAVSWTVTALFAEVGSKRLGALQERHIRYMLMGKHGFGCPCLVLSVIC